MLKDQESLLQLLSKLGITYVNHEHPPVYTVEEADKHHEGIEGVHSKNLFFKDKKKNLFLVVTLSDKDINIKDLAKKIGAKSPSFGKPDLLMEVMGVIPGSVTPFAVVNIKNHDIKIVLDEDMMKHPLLNFHPLVNTATTTVSSADLLKFIEYCGHKPEIIQI
ncbi:putative prolyl-tRNA synthetase associated domain-containing protein 1 [Desulfamplus magnetovallimortis]|uniref:Putative prolyl-tRNA synthetase associated domain-containing protein 1 n=1 Tax=Desulfamplus magnetovallimortis TaxID=1246637 RepID=A0A1W1H5Z6_9BACT|nr:prolyl-tRNA synthetase associated domain-containing protein [Desulfamplus magnetovallimortis]SLM27893.1 putative prolyl-tRNA synthetase associated domain-containing protein 1 [Desulfamplus magnetovallimortis]